MNFKEYIKEENLTNWILKIVTATKEDSIYIEDLIKKLREAVQSESEVEMKELSEKLQNELMEVGKKIYSQDGNNNETPKTNKNEDSVIDADFSETK